MVIYIPVCIQLRHEQIHIVGPQLVSCKGECWCAVFTLSQKPLSNHNLSVSQVNFSACICQFARKQQAAGAAEMNLLSSDLV